ncbi:MAG: hypothetical protein CFH31_00371 [Alphaproteobacteria bacterium MarineAlpha9_Bin1]|nr:MAG: hypothetical protein CFH31_00371 [Alphaproteobacteria bacterium MarineAlpha9_Bin1]
MSLTVRGIKINTGETFKQKAQRGIEKIGKQFVVQNFNVDITLRKIKSKFFGVKILFKSKDYGVINVKSSDNSAMYALSSSITKIEKIIRRLHRKIISNKRHTQKHDHIDYINELEKNDKIYTDNTLIVANMNYKIENLSVAEASNKLINSNRNILMFRNAAHLGLNLLHRHTNGTIEWIDPRGTREAIKL